MAANNAQTILSVQNLGIDFGGLHALVEFSLQVNRAK